MSIPNKWYSLNYPEQTDSPALLVYPDRIRHNINEMIHMAGTPDRLVPHVKTHKMSAVVKMQMEAGIHRFKCATIAEAEMLAMTGVKEILMAYQLNTSKANRFLQLVKRYPEVHFSSLVDNIDSAQTLNKLFARDKLAANVYIDVDNGMNRTGIPAYGDITALYKQLSSIQYIHCKGLHVYDGHIYALDLEERKKLCEAAFAPIKKTVQNIQSAGFPAPEIVAGCSPTFPIHAQNPNVLCSPGTSLFWDEGYAKRLPEQPFWKAAILLTRIISKPKPGYITTDLGYKSVASENPIDKRVFFLNLKNYKMISQSEEHLTIEVNHEAWDKLYVGDALYSIPYHICPTVALYDEAQVVENGKVAEQWEIEARGKRINV
jgi:D-serine deaminase-like pyridoxal phosphate-dependent protein